MKRLLLAAALLACSSSYALAQTACNVIAGETICDPTSFHVSSPLATGSDPVLLNQSNTFTITEVGNHTIDEPLRVYFIEPLGSPLPTISEVTGVGAGGVPFDIKTGLTVATALAFNPVDNLFDGPDVTIASGQDFGKQVGLGDASVSYANFKLAYGAVPPPLGPLTVPTTFQVDDVTIPVGFDSDADFARFIGNFGLGTIIAPLAIDIDLIHNKVTAFDTSWTNAGFVNTTAAGPVPEIPTWAMLLIGFAGLGAGAAARRALRRFAF
jgi:hypothetical protein